MYRVYLFVIGICICCPLIGAKEPLHLLADPTPTVTLDMKRVPLHDGFLNIFRSFSQFTYKGEGSLKAWLTRIMVNEALGYLRKKASTNQEVIVEELPDVIDGDEDDFEQIPQSVLMQFIKELPDGYRTVFNLYVLEEKGHKEIAEMLGITEHTSSSQLYRAKTLLMKKINDYRKRI